MLALPGLVSFLAERAHGSYVAPGHLRSWGVSCSGHCEEASGAMASGVRRNNLDYVAKRKIEIATSRAPAFRRERSSRRPSHCVASVGPVHTSISLTRLSETHRGNRPKCRCHNPEKGEVTSTSHLRCSALEGVAPEMGHPGAGRSACRVIAMTIRRPFV